jgi:hypothetical protein
MIRPSSSFVLRVAPFATACIAGLAVSVGACRSTPTTDTTTTTGASVQAHEAGVSGGASYSPVAPSQPNAAPDKAVPVPSKEMSAPGGTMGAGYDGGEIP